MLQTSYMGLEIDSPIIVSACPLSVKLENMQRMEAAGAGAIVMFSLFEEQLQPLVSASEPHYRVTPDQYMQLLSDASKSLSIPLIASLNGTDVDYLITMAHEAIESGAAGLEINPCQIPTDISRTGREVVEELLEICSRLKEACSVPVSIKLNQYLSSPGNTALMLDATGIDGIVMFSRLFLPDVDLNSLQMKHSVSLSNHQDMSGPLHWLSILHGKTQGTLIGNSGVEHPEHVVKYLLAGADVVAVASCLMRNGIDYLKNLNEGLASWLQQHKIEDVNKISGLLGSSHATDANYTERLDYIRGLTEYDNPYI